MLENWTGGVVGQMHTHRITNKELAKEIGWCEEYVCQILNGKKTPKKAKEKIIEALASLKLKKSNHGGA